MGVRVVGRRFGFERGGPEIKGLTFGEWTSGLRFGFRRGRSCREEGKEGLSSPTRNKGTGRKSEREFI